jgi:teichuronic acid biosynthesis glycosyltransferase TuaC
MTAPIRVLMITSDWPDRASWGGTATFIARQVDFLRAAGVDVDVFRFRGDGNPLRYAVAWLDVQRRLRRERYDLIHAQFGQSGLLALPKRLPLVVTFRGDDLEGVLSNTTGRLTARGRLLPLLSRVVARRADATIVVSAHMKGFLHREAQPHVIPSGLDLERFRLIPQAEARRHLGLSPDRRLVLFVGSPTSSRKRYDLARQAVDIVQRSLPAELVLGWAVPHDQIPYFMNACDALVFTSRQEGSPNVVKEALACNLPVVSVAIGDVPERLRDLAGCEVCADDEPQTIAAALVRALRRGERTASRERVRDLDEHVITARVIGVYRSVLAQTRHGAAGNGGRRVATAVGAP